MGRWVRVVGVEGLREGEMRRVEVEGVPMVVAREGDRPFAFHPLCPHASAELVEGDLRPGYVICPLHAYRFDLTSGRCLKPRDGGPRLRVYSALWREGELWVELPVS